jgi:outer membrane protein assembly factor BamB
VIVADKFPQVAAFDARTGAKLWSDENTAANGNHKVLHSTTGAFLGSPALDGANVVVPDTSDTLWAFNLATGAVSWTAPISSGSSGSPTIDSHGTIYLADQVGNLHAFSASGASLWSIATRQGGPQYASAAVDNGGVVYIGGNTGVVTGYAPASGTATPTRTRTATATRTRTATATRTRTATATRTRTATATRTRTATATRTRTATATRTRTATATRTRTATATRTRTPVP